MSTFFTLWNRTGKPADRTLPNKMLSAEINPFNDGEHVWMDGSIVLGHQHFWVTPEEVGEYQPLVDDSTGCVIASVARLDNRDDLTRSLGFTEMGLRHLSDSRLILMAYRQWGVACPDELLGDFAFTIWDPKEQRIFAARDSLGAEELYYYLSPNLFIAASSVTMIIQHPDVTPQLNEKMIGDYLAVNLEDETQTFYQWIYHLPPAHTLVVEKEKSALKRYWDIHPEMTIRYSRQEEYAEHYRFLLSEAIRCRVRSASPVGVSLSGGLDSSALTCLTAEMINDLDLPQDELRCYSYVFDAFPNCDERSFIDPVIQKAASSIPVTSVKILGDSLYPLPINQDWPVYQSYPYQDPYVYLLKAILNKARQDGVRVLLSGFYGDDLYAGGAYLFADLILEGRVISAINYFKAYHKQIKLKHDLIDYGLRGLIPPLIRKWYRSLNPVKPDWETWIHPQLAKHAQLAGDNLALFAHPKFKAPGKQMRYNALFFTGYALGVNCYKKIARENGMLYTFPYFDRRIVEFIFALPAGQVEVPGLQRKILRESMVDCLPELVRQRPYKTGLSDLFNTGVYQENWAQISKILTQSKVVERAWVQEDWLENELEQQTRTNDGFILWLVLSMELWLQHYWH